MYKLESFVVLALATFLIGPAVAVPLEAGDANEDLYFDAADLVQVGQAAKYSTGPGATWGEGDWNGDGEFNQLDLITALFTGNYNTGAYDPSAGAPLSGVVPILSGGVVGDGQASVVYDAATGEILVDAPNPLVNLTSFQLVSASGIFTGAPAINLGGLFDIDSDTELFKTVFGADFNSISLGNVAQVGLLTSFLLTDLFVDGSQAGGGDLGEVDLIVLNPVGVPEPTTLALFGIGLAGLGFARRKKKSA